MFTLFLNTVSTQEDSKLLLNDWALLLIHFQLQCGHIYKERRAEDSNLTQVQTNINSIHSSGRKRGGGGTPEDILCFLLARLENWKIPTINTCKLVLNWISREKFIVWSRSWSCITIDFIHICQWGSLSLDHTWGGREIIAEIRLTQSSI